MNLPGTPRPVATLDTALDVLSSTVQEDELYHLFSCIPTTANLARMPRKNTWSILCTNFNC